jgi:hypothetical protein
VCAELGLDNWHNVLAVPLHMRPQDEIGMWLRAKLRAGRDAIAAKLRVQEADLTKKAVDMLPDLLKAIAQAKRENPALEI